ncbi:MAG TPA: ornithine cyclodeaminase family protein [Verrucomicrobiae bacterium]|jgi:alanine dehydrogenase|nr:ornithine cyclodeaminase family protein [Verrucomicrobiae bacterium]
MLTGRDVRELLTIQDCITAVEDAFRRHGDGSAAKPGVLGVPAHGGGFHIKAGLLELARPYFAAKVNGNFPESAARFGLPTIQGVIVLCNSASGELLAVMDSIEITSQRTAAATAVAAKYLARRNSRTATICGCGVQGRAQLEALACVLALEKAYAYDQDAETTRSFAGELSSRLGIEVQVVDDLRAATLRSDVCVTCTPSQQALLGPNDVAMGTFVAAVGADSPVKQEIAPDLLASAKIIVDVLEQSLTIGDLHHAVEAGVVTASDVYAELGAIVAGKKPGRTSEEETFIFDSTGMALQDVAAAAAVYENALRAKAGLVLDLALAAKRPA